MLYVSFLKLLVSLCDLRGTHQFPYVNKLDRAVGMAIQKMGPRYSGKTTTLSVSEICIVTFPAGCWARRLVIRIFVIEPISFVSKNLNQSNRNSQSEERKNISKANKKWKQSWNL